MSLAAQLKQLQIPGKASIEDLSSKRVSLLFDLKTSSSLSNDAVLDIGRSGFNELQAIEQLFNKFEAQLFSERCLHSQRNMLTQSENNKLHIHISEYLILLSPYLLLKASQKSLEWLIRRFQIHIYEKDELIACILPYHESQLFGRMMQLFGTSDTEDSWSWLLASQKDASGFSTISLINQCLKNKNLVSFIFKMKNSALEVMKLEPKSGLKLIFSFYARTLVSTIEHCTPLKEDFLSMLLPQIYTGLSSGLKDSVCSSYMIIALVSTKVDLKKEVKKALLTALIKFMAHDWYVEGLLSLVTFIVYQRVQKLPPKSLQAILKLDINVLTEKLKVIQESVETTSLINCLLSSLVEGILSDSNSQLFITFIKLIFDNFRLQEEHAGTLISVVLEKMATSSESLENVNAAELLKVLSIRYSSIFDRHLSMVFNSLKQKKEKSAVKWLTLVVQKCLPSSKHQVLKNTNIPLVLSLNHVEPEIRLAGIKQLLTEYKSNHNEIEPEFLKDALKARLNDDSPEVVNTVLKFSKTICKVLEMNDVVDILLSLLQKSDSFYSLNEFITNTLNNLNSCSIDKFDDFVFGMLGHLFYSLSGKKNNKMFHCIKSVEIKSTNAFIKGIINASVFISGNLKASGSFIDASSFLIFSIADEIVKTPKPEIVIDAFWKYCCKLPDTHVLKSVVLLLFSKLIENPSVLDVITEFNFSTALNQVPPDSIAQISSKEKKELLKNLKNADETWEWVLMEIYKWMIDNDTGNANCRFISYSYFVFVKQIIFSSRKFNKVCSKVLLNLKTTMFSVLSEKSSVSGGFFQEIYRYLLQEFLTVAFASKIELFDFLCKIYQSILNCDNLTESIAKSGLCAMHITKKILTEDDIHWLTLENFQVMFTYVCLLSSPLPMVRETALDGIETFYSITKTKKKFPWNLVLPKCIEDREEIILDDTHVKRVFQSLYTVKNVRRKSEFASLMSSKSKSSKSSEKQVVALSQIAVMLQTLPAIVKLCMLEIFANVELQHIENDLVVIGEHTLQMQELSKIDMKIVISILNRLEAVSVRDNDGSFRLITDCLNSRWSVLQIATLKKINQSFYSQLMDSQKLELLKKLLQLIEQSGNVVLATNARVVLKSVQLLTGHLCTLFEEYIASVEKSIQEHTFLSDSEKVEFTKIPVSSVMIELLEVILYNDNIEQPNNLVLTLFKALEIVMNASLKSANYIRQLCLSALVNATSKKTFNLPEDKFNIEILVQCLQTENDLTTNQECLRLLSNAAKLYPTRVLHHVMHIFSFMGKALLKVDNEMTFSVMEQTINAVVPVLVNKRRSDSGSSRKRSAEKDANDETAMFILETFVDSIPHCPEHRRTHILHHLIGVLNADEYLYLAIVLLIKRVIAENTKKPVDDVDESMEQLSPITLDFCIQLFNYYSVTTQIHCLEGLLHYLHTSSSDEQIRKTPRKKAAVGTLTKPADKQHKVLHYSVMTCIVDVLQSEKIVGAYNFLGRSKQKKLTNACLSFLEKLFAYAQYVNHLSASQAPSAEVKCKIWQNLVRKTYDAIGIVYSLLPFDPFVSIISGLLQRDNHLIKKKSLEILCQKLETDAEYSAEQKLQLVALLEVFVITFKSNTQPSSGETPVNIQLMLYITKLLSLKLIPAHSEVFVNILPTIVLLYSTEGVNPLVMINAVLCVAELCKQLREGALQHLSSIVTPLLALIHRGVDINVKQNVLVISSSLTALQVILNSLSRFMSSFINDILKKLSICEFFSTSLNDSTLALKVKTLKEDISQLVAARVVVPAIKRTYEEMVESEKNLVVTIVDVFGIVLKHISKEDANKNLINSISAIFIQMLGFRENVQKKDSDLKLVNVIEDLVIQAFCDLVLKLSENTLRPMYLQLFTWSTQESELSLKLITFYRLSAKLCKCLKSLFLLFAGHILKKSTDVLIQISAITKDAMTNSDMFYIDLLQAVLDTLCGCFQYDTQGFVDKERFNYLMEPLVNQLAVSIFPTTSSYRLFLKEHLSPCLVMFASAVNDTSCWKPLNHHVLLKTKSANSEVRLAALHVIGEIYSRMGESYMILVPETIPFLSESLEDDSIDVEQKCQDVIKQIEQITGESLQKYF